MKSCLFSAAQPFDSSRSMGPPLPLSLTLLRSCRPLARFVPGGFLFCVFWCLLDMFGLVFCFLKIPGFLLFGKVPWFCVNFERFVFEDFVLGGCQKLIWVFVWASQADPCWLFWKLYVVGLLSFCEVNATKLHIGFYRFGTKGLRVFRII